MASSLALLPGFLPPPDSPLPLHSSPDPSPFLPSFPPISLSSPFFHLPPLHPPPFPPSDSSSSSAFVSSHSDADDDDDDDAVTSSASSLTPSSSSTHIVSPSSPSQNQNGPLDSFDAISSALPIKRGLSRYFSGKSQSFSSLARISSVADLAKPENPFAKRRRMAWQRNGDLHPRHSSYPPTCGAISKRATTRPNIKSPRSLASFPAKCLSVSELQGAGAAL